MPDTPSSPFPSVEALLDATGTAMLLMNTSGVIQWVSDQCHPLLGLKSTDLINKPLHVLGPPLDGEAIWDMEANCLRPIEKPWVGGMVVNLGEGDRSLALRLTPIKSGDFLLEIRPEVAPDQMPSGHRQIQRLASLGRLSGAFAHDYNNVLVGLQGGVSLLKLQPGIDLELIDILEQATERANDLTKQLLGFSLSAIHRRADIDIDHLIGETMKPLRPITRLKARVHLPTGQKLPRVCTDPVAVRQILINLVLNAVEAMTDLGDIRISTQVDSDQSTLTLTVEDNGEGISPEDLERIFEANCSTHGEDRGMGLAASRSLARELGGDLTVESQKGNGTQFTLHLPIAESQSPNESSDFTAPSGEESLTILLVDDEEMVRAMGRRMIEKLGHTAVLAADGQEALRTVRQDPEAIDMLILDMVMPGMNGRELVRSINEIKPGIRAILSSGFLETVKMETLESDGFHAFLQKPYRLEALGRTIEEVRGK